jgi:hypothetical protein
VKKGLGIGITALAVGWLGFVAVVYAMMRRPPDQFAAAMAKMPGPAMLLFPFETMWTEARRGSIDLGDQAPEFRLPTLDKTSEISLASFRGSKPVVLVFGSYT